MRYGRTGASRDFGSIHALAQVDLSVIARTMLAVLGPTRVGRRRPGRAVREVIGLSGRAAAVDDFLTGREIPGEHPPPRVLIVRALDGLRSLHLVHLVLQQPPAEPVRFGVRRQRWWRRRRNGCHPDTGSRLVHVRR